MTTALIVTGSILTYVVIMLCCVAKTRAMQLRYPAKMKERYRKQHPEWEFRSEYDYPWQVRDGYSDWEIWYMFDFLWPLWPVVAVIRWAILFSVRGARMADAAIKSKVEVK